MPASMKKLTKAANDGNPDAQYQLAALFASGERGNKDLEEAARWYEKASVQGHREARYNLGMIHLLGEIGQANQMNGIKLVQSAADLGSWDAQWVLIDIYRRGAFGIRRNRNRAIYYSVMAMRPKHPTAFASLIELLVEVKKENSSALKAIISAGQNEAINRKHKRTLP